MTTGGVTPPAAEERAHCLEAVKGLSDLSLDVLKARTKLRRLYELYPCYSHILKLLRQARVLDSTDCSSRAFVYLEALAGIVDECVVVASAKCECDNGGKLSSGHESLLLDKRKEGEAVASSPSHHDLHSPKRRRREGVERRGGAAINSATASGCASNDMNRLSDDVVLHKVASTIALPLLASLQELPEVTVETFAETFEQSFLPVLRPWTRDVSSNGLQNAAHSILSFLGHVASSPPTPNHPLPAEHSAFKLEEQKRTVAAECDVARRRLEEFADVMLQTLSRRRSICEAIALASEQNGLPSLLGLSPNVENEEIASSLARAESLLSPSLDLLDAVAGPAVTAREKMCRCKALWEESQKKKRENEEEALRRREFAEKAIDYVLARKREQEEERLSGALVSQSADHPFFVLGMQPKKATTALMESLKRLRVILHPDKHLQDGLQHSATEAFKAFNIAAQKATNLLESGAINSTWKVPPVPPFHEMVGRSDEAAAAAAAPGGGCAEGKPTANDDSLPSTGATNVDGTGLHDSLRPTTTYAPRFFCEPNPKRKRFGGVTATIYPPDSHFGMASAYMVYIHRPYHSPNPPLSLLPLPHELSSLMRKKKDFFPGSEVFLVAIPTVQPLTFAGRKTYWIGLQFIGVGGKVSLINWQPVVIEFAFPPSSSAEDLAIWKTLADSFATATFVKDAERQKVKRSKDISFVAKTVRKWINKAEVWADSKT